jgi:hypothetical protein
VSMKLQEIGVPHNTWCVRISQHTGWSIVINAAHGCTTFPPHLLLSSVVRAHAITSTHASVGGAHGTTGL